MRGVGAVALATVALLGAVAIAVPTPVAGPAPSGVSGSPAQQGVGAVQTGTNNSSMGSDVSSFMQSTTGEAGEEIEAGMWNAAYDDAPNRTSVVERRTASIDARLQDLQRQKEQVERAYENGSISRVEYRARMSRIVGRMAGLNRSIDETAGQAHAVGADASAVERLREAARNLSGPEIAAIARSMAGGPPSGAPAGPNGMGPPNGTGPPDDAGGPPEDPSESRGNGTGGGPPDDGGKDNDGGGTGGGANDGGENDRSDDLGPIAGGVVTTVAPARVV